MNLQPSEEVLIDTDALSFAFNEDPVREPRYSQHVRGKLVRVSFVTPAEMRFGALLRRWGPRRLAELERFLAEYTVVESNPGIA